MTASESRTVTAHGIFNTNDFIQSHIVLCNEYFEQDILDDLNKYIPDSAVILDVGANIGNHVLYWGMERRASQVICFEPVQSTYNMLVKNVEINGLSDRVILYNLGLSDIDENADYLSYREENIGDTHLRPDANGIMRLVKLDSLELKLNKIDFIKIDVEDYEIKVLKGMEKTLKRYSPLLLVESLPHQYEIVDEMLISWGMTLVKSYDHHNYLYAFTRECEMN